jgi:hypothetical protein
MLMRESLLRMAQKLLLAHSLPTRLRESKLLELKA